MDSEGQALNETVGADSGTGTQSSIPGPPVNSLVLSHRIPSGHLVRDPFTARCGEINISATWRFDSSTTNWSGLRINLYDPAGKKTDSAPIGAAEGNLFTLSYLISANQVKKSTQWTAEFINRSNRNVEVTAYINTDDEDCPQIVSPPATSPASSKQRLTFRNGHLPSSNYFSTADVTLEQAKPGVGQGNLAECYVDGDDPPQSGKDRSTILWWDVGAIPVGSKIDKAWITLEVTNASKHAYQVYAMKRGWSEAQATWQRASGNRAWQRNGARDANDRDSTSIGTVGPAAIGLLLIPLTSRGVTLIQRWVDGTSLNYGLIIAGSNPTDGLDFHCSEAKERNARPALTVEYRQ